MIQRIKRLRDFGIYRDFTGDDQSAVPPFKKRNLIYGWNYSGKTTLSRLFQSLQFPDRPLVHGGCRFTVKLAVGVDATETNRVTQNPIRVFNRDYINANFQEEHTAPAVFIVGEENLALRTRLEALRSGQEKLRERERERQGLIDRLDRDDAAAGTTRATAIGQVLGVRDFRRPNLDARIQQVRGDLPASLLPDDRRQATIDTFRSGDQFTEIASPQLPLPDLVAEIANTRALLGRTASFDAIEGLRGNPTLEAWLRTGLSLHPSASHCQFCGGPLPADRLALLQRHFSTASQELLTSVDRGLQRLRNFQFQAPRLDALQFLQEVREGARRELDRINHWLEHAAGIVQSLIAALDNKRTALEVRLEWHGSEDRLGDGAEVLAALNRCIQQHNERVQNMGGVKRQAREAIERHFAAVHFAEQNLAEHDTKRSGLRRRISHAVAGRQRLERAAQEIAAQIDRAARGAGRFMELVAFLLRGSEIRVESRNESLFQLMRGTLAADRLSEGEKTAIAFAYFVTSLEGDNEAIANTVVYVDDPISSLDSNHVYAVYALITERLQKAHQLFVSTHNSEFFSLLKEQWVHPRSPLRSDSEAFYVLRQADTAGSYANLIALPRQLRKFKSEYEFLFALLHTFANSNNASEHEAYSAPNLLRRFLEAYLGFRKPCTPAWHEKLDLILESDVERREIHKLLDDASHLQSTGRALREPAFVASSQACVQSVLSGLERNDPSHYQSLVTIVNN